MSNTEKLNIEDLIRENPILLEKPILKRSVAGVYDREGKKLNDILFKDNSCLEFLNAKFKKVSDITLQLNSSQNLYK